MMSLYLKVISLKSSFYGLLECKNLYLIKILPVRRVVVFFLFFLLLLSFAFFLHLMLRSSHRGRAPVDFCRVPWTPIVGYVTDQMYVCMYDVRTYVCFL